MTKSTTKKATWTKSKTQGALQEAPSALVFKEQRTHMKNLWDDIASALILALAIGGPFAIYFWRW